jgi:hypothetical protein
MSKKFTLPNIFGRRRTELPPAAVGGPLFPEIPSGPFYIDGDIVYEGDEIFGKITNRINVGDQIHVSGVRYDRERKMYIPKSFMATFQRKSSGS